jgi:dynein heavy chain
MHGKTVLFEDVDSALDPSLDNLFSKSIYVEDGIQKINFGEKAVNYDDDFNFFLSTKLANPHFLPEICIKLSIVNFTVTPAGLQD